MSIDKKYKENLFLYILVFVAFLLGTIFVVGILLLMWFKKFFIDVANINLLDMYIKASYAFFGSFFSGMTALMMFLKQQKHKKEEENKNLKAMFDLAVNEKNANLKSIRKVTTHISNHGVPATALALGNLKEMKELFLIVYTDINISAYLQYDKETTKLVSSENKKMTYVYKIYKLLKVLLEEVEEKSSMETILSLIVDNYNNAMDIAESDLSEISI